MGTQLPQKKGTPTPPNFLAHVYCGQTAGWIKMPLGTEVNLGPGDVVLDGVATPPPLTGALPNSFRFMSIVTKRPDGRMKTPLGTKVDLGPGHVVLDEAQLPAKGALLCSTHVYCGHGRPSQLLLSSC